MEVQILRRHNIGERDAASPGVLVSLTGVLFMASVYRKMAVNVLGHSAITWTSGCVRMFEVSADLSKHQPTG